MDLSELGFTKEELQQRVIDGIVEQLMQRGMEDEEDGHRWIGETEFKRELDKQITKGINDAVAALAETHVLPNVAALVEGVTLQETNRWGEATGTPVTFIEYLTARAEKYLTEDVNYEGKSKGEANGFSWTKAQSRITHLVNQHLHYSIKTAMEQSLQAANSAIASGIESTVKAKLEEVVKTLKVTAQVGR